MSDGGVHTVSVRTQRRSALTPDDGIAIVTVLGVMLVVTLLAIGSFTLARESLFQARKAEGETRAFRVAAAGLDSVLSGFSMDSADAVATAGGTLAYPAVHTTDGTATVTCRKTDGDAGEYEIVSIGVGVDGATETVAQKFYWFNIWEMNFAGTGSQSLMSGSSGLNGSSNIYGPFYVRGNLSLDAFFTVRDGPLFVKDGTLATTSSATEIGLPDKRVRIYCDGTTDLTKGTLYYEGPFISVPRIELPSLTLQDMRGNATTAQTQSSDNLMSRTDLLWSSTMWNAETFSQGPNYKYFGTGNIEGMTLGGGTTKIVLGSPSSANSYLGKGSFGQWGSVDTTGQVIPAGGTMVCPNCGLRYAGAQRATCPTCAAAWDWPYTSALRNRWDDFAYWDNPTGIVPSGWDLMFISGTVFIDGPLTISDNVLYIGNGTLVVNGPIILDGKVRPYSYSTAAITVNKVGEDKKWALGMVTPSTITMNGYGSNSGVDPVRDNAFDYAGAFYTDSTLSITRPLVSVRGSILSKKMEILGTNGDIVTNPLLPTYLPDSLPGGDAGVITPGIWSRS